MKILLVPLLTLSGFCIVVKPQSPQWNALSTEEKEIVQVIVDVFDGMRAGDSAAVKSHFYPHVSANTAFISNEGNPELKIDNINNWFNAIGKPHDQI